MKNLVPRSKREPLYEGRLTTLRERAKRYPDPDAVLRDVESRIVWQSEEKDAYRMRMSDWKVLRDKYRPGQPKCKPKPAPRHRPIALRRADGSIAVMPDTPISRAWVTWMRLQDRLRPGEVIAAVSKLLRVEETEGCGCKSLRRRMNRMGWSGTLRWLFSDEGRRWLACVPKRMEGVECQLKVPSRG